MLDDYVYRNLRSYRNCYITESDYKKIGHKRILKDLKKHGFNCDITVYCNLERTYIDQSGEQIKAYNNDVIISLK